LTSPATLSVCWANATTTRFNTIEESARGQPTRTKEPSFNCWKKESPLYLERNLSTKDE
jgi:hypothetical protein